jgi:hypothetical protein
MAGYVDGFVMPLRKSNVGRYREVATTAGGLAQGNVRSRAAYHVAGTARLGHLDPNFDPNSLIVPRRRPVALAMYRICRRFVKP